MPRTTALDCASLYRPTGPGKLGHVSLPQHDKTGNVPMRRIYSRPK